MGCFSSLDRVFLGAAGLGAAAMLVRLIGLFAGVDGDDGDDFQILSLHGLSSFFTIFGLVGIALNRQSGAGAGLSLLGGILAGAAAVSWSCP